jgi:hypothetical protein
MRTILLALAIAALPASTALAQQLGPHKPDKAALSGKLPPLKGASSGNSCAAFGAGFVKVEGSDSCVKIGGATSIGAGASGGGR